MSIKTTWVIGGDPGCDLVVDLPSVSRRHCRLSRGPDGSFSVLDLGSTNGTFVNGVPISVETPVRRVDTITLGHSALMPWPDIAGVPDLIFRGTVMTVGRDPGCDRVVNLPVVSGRHARFFRTARMMTVEDLGSSNGTFVNSRRVESTTPVAPGDLIGLGTHVVRLVDGGAGPTTDAAQGSVRPASPPAGEPVASLSATGSRATAFVAGLGLALQSILIAGIVVALRTRSTAAALFGLCVGSVWVGLCSAFFERILNRAYPGIRSFEGPTPYTLARSLAVAALATLLPLSILMGVVPVFIPEAGRWPVAFGVLGLTGLVGAAAGSAVARRAGRVAWGIPPVVGLLLLMSWLSAPAGWSAQAGRVSRPAASAAVPTRWSFEALSLLAAGKNADNPETDPVALDFPAETDRSGVPACVTALLAMLVGVVYADAVIALTWRPAPPR